jgi:uncharacterized protein
MILKVLLGLGLVFVVLVAVQISLLAFGLVSRLRDEAKRRKLERQILSEQFEAVRCRRLKEEKSVLPWHGNRKFRIERKETECKDVISFYLTAHDRKPLPEFLPGQYLTFELDAPGRQKRLVRCYSLSDRPRPDRYRVTIKLIRAPADSPNALPGIASTFFHQHLQEGDIVDVRAPNGGFCLDPSRPLPVVFIAGGIGVTPLLSMLHEIVETGSKRETWFFLGARNGDEHAFKKQIEKIARENEKVRLYVCYSQPRAEDQPGQDFQHAGRLSVDLLRTVLPSNNYDFFLCCPSEMMQEMDAGLRRWGVPEKSIHTEAFGAATVKRTARSEEKEKTSVEWMVHFSKSNRSVQWTGKVESLLDLATTNEVAIDSGCRAGNCGTCKVAIKSGEVKYLRQPGCVVEAGTCLTCCCVPVSELALDA